MVALKMYIDTLSEKYVGSFQC